MTGLLRRASFQGLRSDKNPRDVRRETPETRPTGRHAISTQGSANAKMSNSVAGVKLTHPDKVLYPDAGVTKHDLAAYYEAVQAEILPGIIDRPLTIVRCPQGQDQKCFYQKHWTDSLPDAVGQVCVKEKRGEEPYTVIHDLPGLIALVQMSVLELHPWSARIDRLERPDQLIFDLDPGEGVSWNDVKQAAVEVRNLLQECDLQSFVRTTGGKGLHVVAPVTRRHDWETSAAFSEAVANVLATRSPDRYVTNMRKAARTNRVFIDYLRNKRGATAIASYSTRARPGAPVAMPLSWDELPELQAANFWTVRNAPQRVAKAKTAAWAGFASVRQSITADAQKHLRAQLQIARN